jgi:C1A family cysteine protease
MWRIPSITLLFLTASGATRVESEASLSVELMSKFKGWVDFHQKMYDSHENKMERLNIWLNNDERIEAHNNQNPTPSFTLGHNEFSDMTEDEFAQYFRLGPYASVRQKEAAQAKIMDPDQQISTAERRRLWEEQAPLTLPDYMNWVQAGAVTPMKNQGACGSCWAFSTTGALEGAKFLKTGELVALSEQHLIDCDKVDLGCNGGLMDNAFKFDMSEAGLCSEEEYPYLAKQSRTCMTNCTKVEGSGVKTFIDVPPGDEKALLSAIAMQPISVAIQASQFVFQFYKNGVLTDDSCGSRASIDHGVLAVGYGTDVDTNEPYFLVKNSWGETWGDKGYVKLGRGGKNEFGMCAILKMASFPVVE